MKPTAPSSGSLRDLRDLTPARVRLGRVGASMPTKALLDFALDHARARDAIHSVLDVPAMISGLNDLGLKAFNVCSCAHNRKDYLKRPDLGRALDPASRDLLAGHHGSRFQFAIVVGDGLSPMAANAHAIELARSLIPRLAADRIQIGHAVVASGARVALGDEIGAILGVGMVAMVIGERPGLSAPDSLGVYLTFGPKPGRTDAERNCVSNIHGSGLGYDEAAFRIAWLIREGLAREVTGVALKDESARRTPHRIRTNTKPA